jgi:hypothetical protein
MGQLGMRLFGKSRQDKAAFEETRAGGATIQLFTRDRGPREFTVSLSLDEIEDLIRAADNERSDNPYRAQITTASDKG